MGGIRNTGANACKLVERELRSRGIPLQELAGVLLSVVFPCMSLDAGADSVGMARRILAFATSINAQGRCLLGVWVAWCLMHVSS